MTKKQIMTGDLDKQRMNPVDSVSRRQFIGMTMLAATPGSFASPSVFAQEKGLRADLVMIDGWILCESDLERLDMDVY